MCSGRRDVTEILLKTMLNTIQSINHIQSEAIHDQNPLFDLYLYLLYSIHTTVIQEKRERIKV